MTGKQHAKLLGLLFWLFTALNVLTVVAIAVIYIAIFGLVFSQAPPQRPGEPDPAVIMMILAAVFVFALVMTILFSVPKMIAGYGLRHEKPWAKTWAIVACVMAVMSFPFGTAIGVYGLIFLLGDEGKKYFGDPSYGRQAVGAASPVTPPEPNSWA